MEYKMDEQILQSAINTYGSRSQHDMLLEEISELQKEICKNYRNVNNEPQIMEEMADVLIMIEQVKMMHKIKNEDIQKVIDFKLARLNKRVNEEIEKRHEVYCDLERGYGCVFDE